VKTAASMEIL